MRGGVSMQRTGIPAGYTDGSAVLPGKGGGAFLASIAGSHAEGAQSEAFIAGGETVVRLTEKGVGGRNQELALAAAPGIAGLENMAVFSVGSDGTDGPTDAAGCIVNGEI